MKVLEVNNLKKVIGKREIIKNISFSIKEGEIFGFLGPNGAGKTTTIRMLVGLIKPTSGSILVCGNDLKANPKKSLKEVGAVVENPELYKYLSGRENLMQIARIRGISKEKVNETIALVSLTDRIDDKFGKYSLGMKQRLGLAASLLSDPKLLILDEPTNGLDPSGILDFREIVKKAAKERGMAVFISSHILSEVQNLCDRVAFINNGVIKSVEYVTDNSMETETDIICLRLENPINLDILKNLSYINSVKMTEENLSYLEYSLQDAKEANDEEWARSIEESIKYHKENIENNKDILENGIDEDSWIKILDENIISIKEVISNYEKEGISKKNEDHYEDLKYQLENLTYLKENNLKPLEGWEFTSNNFIKNGSMLFGMAILVAGIAVFISDMVSGEATPPTLKFLLIQPVSRGKVLFSKYLVALSTVLTLIIIPQIVGIGVVNLTSEINDSNHPITIGQEYEKVLNIETNEMELKAIPNTSERITMKEFNFKSLAFQGLFIAATTSVVFMFSTLFKSSMISMATSVILTVFMTIAGQAINPIKKVAHILFTTYADSVNILNSNGVFMTNNHNVTIKNGIICLVMTLIISYLISHINFTRKDMLI